MKLCGLVSPLVLSLALASAIPAAAAPVPPEDYAGLHWRLVGPLRGGWGDAARRASRASRRRSTSAPPAAACGGPTDAGRTWNPLFEHETASSIGALAVAPSDPKVLYVGTGQVPSRARTSPSGAGVYRSGDGGKTWEARRARSDSRHIGRIWSIPATPTWCWSPRSGHVFGPNPERGVFRTTDGGQTWSKALFVERRHRRRRPRRRPRAIPTSSSPPPGRRATIPGSPTSRPTIGPGSGDLQVDRRRQDLDAA